MPTPSYFFYHPGKVDDSRIGDNEELIEEDSDAEFKEELFEEEPQQCAACEPISPDDCTSGQTFLSVKVFTIQYGAFSLYMQND